MNYLVVFITAANKDEARKIARSLVAKRLVACVNIVPAIESIFTWKGKLEVAKEVLLIAKTKAELFSKVERCVKRLHSYECPEIIAFEIAKGNKDYLRWVEGTTL
ncbi:MAG: divalent-cation tolerance protein CutA [Candidatus Omnitrophota bacterium]